MPHRLTDATVLVLDGQDEGGLRAREVGDRYTANVTSPSQLAALQDPEAERRDRIVRKLQEYGVDVVVAKQGIEKSYARELARAGIVGVDGVTRLYLGQVAKATGATPTKRTEDFDADALGHAGLVEELSGEVRGTDRTERRMVVFDECDEPAAVCVLLRGVWGPLATGATRELRKAAAAVAAAQGADGGRAGVLPGGGSTEARVAKAVRQRGDGVSSREQLAFTAFADAVETLIFALAKNGGLDPLTVAPDIWSANDRYREPRGLALPAGDIVDVEAAGIVDPRQIRQGCYVAAVEVASLLLGIDDAVPATGTDPSPDPGDTIYEDAAEQQRSYLSKHDDTRWAP